MAYDLRDTVDRDRKTLPHFTDEKNQVALFDRSNNSCAIDVRMDGSILKEKLSLKILGLSLLPKLDWGSYIVSIAKTVSQKIETLISCMRFLSVEVVFYFFRSTIRRPCMEYCFHVCASVLRCLLGKY